MLKRRGAASTAIVLAVAGLVALAAANLAAMALAGLVVARAFGVRAGKLPFKHPPRESFDAASRFAFGAVVAVGPLVSYLCAVSVFVAVDVTAGRPARDATVDVVPGGRAEAAGIRSGDRIVALDGKPISRFDDVKSALAGRAEAHLPVVVERGDQRLDLEVITDEAARIQVQARAPRRVEVALGDAIATALGQPLRVLAAGASGFADVLSPKVEVMAGPAGIVAHTSRDARDDRAQNLRVLATFNAYYWPMSFVVAYAARPRKRAVPITPRREAGASG